MKSSAMHHRSHRTFLGIVLIVFWGIALYSSILHAPFIFDDYSSIVDNDAIKSIKNSLLDLSNNRYLSMLSFAFNYAAFGLKPFSYHLVNNLIHIINALLVYYLVIFTFKTPYFSSQQSAIHPFTDSPIHPEQLGTSPFTHSPLFIAFSAAFIFVSHPIQTQAVTYIAQRATSMATMFYLLSLVMYIKFRIQDSEYRMQDKKPFVYRASWIIYLCSIISAIFAMKTKEIAFTLPIMVALYEFSFFNKSPNAERQTPNLRRFLYLLPILLTLLIIPLSMLNFTAPVEVITQDIDVYSRETVNITRMDYLLTQFRVIVTYLRLLIMPVNQSLDYRYPVYHSFFDSQVFLSFLFLLIIFGFAVYLTRKSRIKIKPPSFPLSEGRQGGSDINSPIHRFTSLRLIAFGVFWFFITLSVESSVIPIKDIIFEHRLYLPSIGFFIASVSVMEYFIRQKKVKIFAIIIVVTALSVAAFNRNLIWNDPQALWENVLVKFPNNVRAYNGLGVIFKEQEEYDKALIQFERVLEINSNYFPAYYNMGDVQYKLGDYKAAVTYFIKVLKLNPSYHFHLDTLNSLAITYSEMGDAENAVNAFKEAIKLFPSSVMLYNNLGRQYIKMGDFDSAIEILKKGIEVREEPHLRSNLAIAYAAKEQRNKNAGQIKK